MEKKFPFCRNKNVWETEYDCQIKKSTKWKKNSLLNKIC